MPLIQAARKGNYHTIVCDADPNAPGVPLANEYHKVSTKDREGLLKVAIDKKINGIIANSDYAMCDVAYIANTLNLVGNHESAIETLSSKSKFRELQKKEGLFAPNYLSVESSEQINTDSLSFPIIIKPDQNAGSRGTTLIDNPNDTDTIKESAQKCIELSRNGKAVIEEFIPMPTNAVIEGEIFINQGEILWDGLFLTIRNEKAIMLPMTYVFPLPETPDRIEKAKEALTTVFQATGIVHGEYNIEMYFTEKGEPFIIEINPRQGGYDLPKYVQQHCGIDYYRLLVTTSMGEVTFFNSLKKLQRTNRHITHHMIFPRKKGCFQGVEIDISIKKYVYKIGMFDQAGKIVSNSVDADSCIGYIDLEFPNPQTQLRISKRIEELIKI